MKLTSELMKAMILARAVNTRAKAEGVTGESIIRSDYDLNARDPFINKHNQKVLDAELVEYKQGVEGLKKYTLRFTDRSTVAYYSDGTTPKPNDPDILAVMRIEAGYIANSTAYETAVFKARGK